MKKKKKNLHKTKKGTLYYGIFICNLFILLCDDFFKEEKKKKHATRKWENAFLGAIFHMYLSLKIIKFSFLFTMKLSVGSCLLFIVNPIIYCIIFIVVANHPSRFFLNSPSFSHFELRVHVICLFFFKTKN
jgi:hypothetical protein